MSQIIELSDDVLQKLNQIENAPAQQQVQQSQFPQNGNPPQDILELLGKQGVNTQNMEVTKPLPQPTSDGGIATARLHSSQVETFFVSLPSQGKLYPQGNGFSGMDKVQMRKIDIFDDDILSSEVLSNNNTTWTTLLKSVFVNKNLDPDDLFESDRTALIVGLRGASYGRMYNSKIKYKCDFCNVAPFEWTFDLSALLPLDITEDYPHTFNNFKVTLPCNKEAIIKLFTIKDSKKLKDTIAKTNARSAQVGIDRTPSTLIRHHILALDGVTENTQLNDLMYTLTAIDKKWIFQFLEKIEPQLNFKHTINCPLCSGTLERTMLLTDEFLNPTVFE